MEENDDQAPQSPVCERMKSRNDSFDKLSSPQLGSEAAAGQPSEEDDDDASDAFVNYASSDDDCMQFFDATQFLNNSRGASSQQQQQQRALGNAPQHDPEEELQEAVAYSGALVGENVLDSPTNSGDQRRASLRSNSSSPIIPCLRDANSRSIPRTGASNNNNNAAVDPGLSAGLVAQGFAWVRSQRELRRRRYLQYQAEQQLRKIKAAQNAEKQGKDGTSTGSRGLFGNPIFQNLASVGGGGSADGLEYTDGLNRASSSRSDGDRDVDEYVEAEDRLAAQATVSQSGAGYTVELDVSMSEEEEDASWIPPVRIEEEEVSEERTPLCLLTEDQRQQIACHVLPSGIAYAKWRRVYSLARDGDSFDMCLRLVKDYNQTILIVRTSKNEIFGGFADAAWEQPSLAGAQFYGGPGACLFSVPDPTKSKILAYKWTGANRYIQLTDSHRKLLAFGGGGEEGSFGLCVESDFQRGSTGHCDTFGNEPLCSEENFHIVDVEIFGFLLGQF